MVLENKLNITDLAELARQEERSKTISICFIQEKEDTTWKKTMII